MPARVSPARRSGAHKSPKEREAGQAQQHLHEAAQDGGQHGQGTEHERLVPPLVRRSKSRVGTARRPPGGRRTPASPGGGDRDATSAALGEPRARRPNEHAPASLAPARRPGPERGAGGDRTARFRLKHKSLFDRSVDAPSYAVLRVGQVTAPESKKATNVHGWRANRPFCFL